MSKAKQTTPMTFSELVDETVEHYTNNPRSREGDTGPCVYAGENGERCAAARLCDESRTQLIDMEGGVWSSVHNQATLKPEYAHFDVEQIGELQNLHDYDGYWLKPDGERGTEGLSEIGKQTVEIIKAKYTNPETP